LRVQGTLISDEAMRNGYIFLLICWLVGTFSSEVAAQTTRSRLESLDSKRELRDEKVASEIKKIDLLYQKSLVKMKDEFTKAGDLKAAVAVEEELSIVTKRLERERKKVGWKTDRFVQSIADKKWSWRHRWDNESWIIFKDDGSVKFGSRKGFEWDKIGKYEIRLLRDGKYKAVLKWNNRMDSYTGIDGESTKIWGKVLSK